MMLFGQAFKDQTSHQAGRTIVEFLSDKLAIHQLKTKLHKFHWTIRYI